MGEERGGGGDKSKKSRGYASGIEEVRGEKEREERGMGEEEEEEWNRERRIRGDMREGWGERDGDREGRGSGSL